MGEGQQGESDHKRLLEPTSKVKMPLQVIGKAKCPRCFKGLNMKLLPVVYNGQTNVWMTCDILHAWFHHSFVPTVRDELSKLGLLPKAVLVLDNCPAHPEAEELVSDDGNIFAHFLPPNVTSLIQPMDQGVLVALKRRYKRKLLHRLIIEEENGASIVDFFKSVNTTVVVEMTADSWDEIRASTLRKSWRKIVPMQAADPQTDQ